ncbi:MAG: efflux RND transporter periplasmic adaptor subunit [Epsilonproteobacteria bacterium]|nr:efflux RND transporter periplasmic adaptor subunit [Campylobacterota bacterium]
MKKILLTLITLISLSHAENVYAIFNVVAAKDAKLAFIASGIVENVNVSIGSEVKKGAVLATLANDDIKAMLASAQTTLKYAKRNLDRQEKIKKLIDEGKFDQIVSAYEKAKDAVAYQKALYAKTFLKAPFDGVIYDKAIEIGDAVSGMILKTVFKIQSLHARKLILEFDQKYNRLVKPGKIFEYTIDGDPKTYKGVISKVYPYANFNNRKIRAEVEAKNITVGLFGDGYILTDER